MFRSMHYAIDLQDFLRARNAHVIYELAAEMPEPGTVARPGAGRHPGAARAAVKVEAELRARAAQAVELGRQDFVDIRVAFEELAETILHHHGDAQIGAKPFQDIEG